MRENPLKELLRGVLTRRSEEIARDWETRIAELTPLLDADERRRFVQEMMTALGIYLLDNKLQPALKQFDEIVAAFFDDAREGAAVVVRALLLCRYILLGRMVVEGGGSFNSIAAFGFLNELFQVPAIAVFEQHNIAERPVAWSGPFSPSCAAEINALDFACVGFVVLDAEGTVIYFSRGGERLTERPSAETVGRSFFGQFPDWQPLLDDPIRQALAEGRGTERFGLSLTVDRKRLTVDVKIEPLRAEDGRVVGCTLAFAEVRPQHLDLHPFRYARYFENILNDAADAIILLNENHRIIMWNKAAQQLFGYSEAQVFGKSLIDLAPDDRAVREEMARMDEQVGESGFIRNQRLTLLSRDGRSIMAELTRTALRNDRGDFIGSSVILRDISEQEQLRRQVIQSEKLSAVGTLAAGIAHEVGTPLTSISALAQILQLKSDNPEFKEKLALIQESIDRISRTVRTLVDFSRPITEKVEDLYLNNVIEHVIRILKYDKRLKHQEIVTRLSPDIPLVRAGFDQILQVFINICLNAADAMEGKKDGRLEVATWHEGRTVFASVTDNGCGIPAEHLGHIFEPFFTTKKSGKGTGLGLWVSYNIVTGCGGDIKVQSREGEGTTFTISLPAA